MIGSIKIASVSALLLGACTLFSFPLVSAREAFAHGLLRSLAPVGPCATAPALAPGASLSYFRYNTMTKETLGPSDGGIVIGSIQTFEAKAALTDLGYVKRLSCGRPFIQNEDGSNRRFLIQEPLRGEINLVFDSFKASKNYFLISNPPADNHKTWDILLVNTAANGSVKLLDSQTDSSQCGWQSTPKPSPQGSTVVMVTTKYCSTQSSSSDSKPIVVKFFDAQGNQLGQPVTYEGYLGPEIHWMSETTVEVNDFKDKKLLEVPTSSA